MNIREDIRQTFDLVYSILKPELPYGLEEGLVLSNQVKRAWGKIKGRGTINGESFSPVNGSFRSIVISVPNFMELYNYRVNNGAGNYMGTTLSYKDKLIETICHEFAHMTYWNHKKDHKNLTAHYIDMVAGVAGNMKSPLQSVAESIIVSLADIVKDPKKARVVLRKAGIQKPGSRWEWSGDIPKEVKELLKGL